jgi:hypothetical protein
MGFGAIRGTFVGRGLGVEKDVVRLRAWDVDSAAEAGWDIGNYALCKVVVENKSIARDERGNA